MSMTLQEFENKYMGKVVRDGQCVALFRQYVQDCYSIPHTGSVDGAYDLWTSYDINPKLKQYFDKITDRPQVGDCVIFEPTKTNKYGHIAIATDVHLDGINVIEQDGFKLNGVKPAFWTYTRYVGALRPKNG